MMLSLGKWEEGVQNRLEAGKGDQEFTNCEDARETSKWSCQVGH